MKKSVIVVSFLFVIILVSAVVFASFTIEEDEFSIQTQYSLGSKIKGFFNISFDNELTSSLFETSLEGSISLIKLLGLNPSFVFSCNPLDCNTNYKTVLNSNEISKTFSLGARESKVIGLRFFGGDLTDFEDGKFSMIINSDAGEVEFKQLSIDFFDDDEIEWESYRASRNFYGENYGCYESQFGELIPISNIPFCETINIPIAPNVEVGAIINKTTNENVNDSDGKTEFILSINGKGCEVTALSSGRIGCVIDLKIEKQGNFDVCIKVKNDRDRQEYNINSEINGSVCGYVESSKRDFEIFAKPGFYKKLEPFELNDIELNNFKTTAITIESKIKDYVEERYDNDCSDECIVPIRFTSGKNQEQEITISEVKYVTQINNIDSGFGEDHEIYNLSETFATISAEKQKLKLDKANFSTPDSFGDYEFTLTLNNREIFTEDILVEKIPEVTGVSPTTVIAASPTEFTAFVETFESNASIISYDWDFGNGITQKTTENKATHTYNNLGSETITVTIKNSEGLSSSNNFNIKIATPEEAVNILLSEKLEYLNNIKIQIQEMPSFLQSSFNSLLDLDKINEIISDLQKRNATAVSDQHYIGIMAGLVALSVPKSIETIKQVNGIPFFPSEDIIDIEIINDIRGSSNYTSNLEEDYTQAALIWYLENVLIFMDYSEFVVVYEDRIDGVLNSYKLTINKNSVISGSFFIIPKFENLMFKEDYSEKEIGSSYYIELDGNSKVIEFSMTEKIDFLDLPIFVSPSIIELSKTIIPISGEIKGFRQTLFILVMLLLIFIGFISYVVLQQWYKKKYEGHLFKNKNDLFNLISFIQSMKKKNLINTEIFSKLRKVGWSSEQVNYIMKKYHGKRTGMYEIPVNKAITVLKRSNQLKNQLKKDNNINGNRDFNTRKFNKGI